MEDLSFNPQHRAVFSTPKKDDMPLSKRKPLPVAQLNQILAKASYGCVLDDTVDPAFKRQFSAGKNFKVHGVPVSLNELQGLIPKTKSITATSELYVSNFVIDAYLRILLNENRKHIEEKNLEIFVTYTTECNPVAIDYRAKFDIGISHFLAYDVGVKEIVLIPFIKSSHTRLLIVLLKKKIVIYLDPMHDIEAIPTDEIKHVMTLFKAYYDVREFPFSLDGWQFYAPTDTPIQPNYFDCGVLVCLFAETVITQQDAVEMNIEDHIFLSGRLKMQKKIFDKMQMVSYPIFPENRTYLENPINIPEIGEISISKNSVEGIPTISYLQYIIEDYWGTRDSECYQCCQPPDNQEDLVLCCGCWGWYHPRCGGSTLFKIPKFFLCSDCKVFKKNEMES